MARFNYKILIFSGKRNILQSRVCYPPLCGIVQLANFHTLRYENWSFKINFIEDVENRMSI